MHALPELEAREWLVVAKMNRVAHNAVIAADAAIRAEALGSSAAKIEQAKLLMTDGLVRVLYLRVFADLLLFCCMCPLATLCFMCRCNARC